MGREKPKLTVLESLAELPTGPGAYMLMFEIAKPLAATIGRLGPVVIAPGRYAYVGSARGPGGIAARVRRHAQRAKSHRWHIDTITSAVGLAGVAVYGGGDECALGAALINELGATAPVKGLGSSDCTSCPSHFLRLPEGLALYDVPARLPLAADAIWVRSRPTSVGVLT